MAHARRRLVVLAGVLAIALFGSASSAQSPAAARPAATAASPRVTSPMQEWGHNVGDDYFVVNYQQVTKYWRKLEKESPRIKVVDIGKSSEGRPMLMAIVTAPENHAKLARYKEIVARLANAEGLTDDQAKALAKEGRSVVWIDGGLHATETVGAQQLIEHVYQMVSRTDEETTRFLRDVIQLCTFVNPDGMDLVSDWYMKRGTMNIPVLYNKYAGHDDNRDFYMSATDESTNINRVLYREWYPQIVYNHHQTGPSGTVMFSAPFRDPFNYFQHPYAISAIDTVGSLMRARFYSEGKPGVTTREGMSYSTWFNGGLRTTAHFHNMIGILTETIGNPTPINIPFVPNYQVASSNIYWPIQPQSVWHYRQSIDYSVTADRAIVDYASRYREKALYDLYWMGRDEIRWGSEDHWTFTPHRMAKVQEELVARGAIASPAVIPGAASTLGAGGGQRGGGGGQRGGGAGSPLYDALRAKELRDARGYIIPSDQPDFATATKFVNALIKTGITIHRAAAPFTVNGKQYPVNSYVVKTAQAFRPHVLDMFEPQDHPDDIPYPGGPPTPPYDATGYTLAFTMGVQFDRVLDAFDGPFQKIDGFAKVPAGAMAAGSRPPTAGFYFSHAINDSFIAVNRLLKAGESVSWMANGPMGPGTFYVAARATTLPILQKASVDLGVTFQAAASAPTGQMAALKLPRIGLFDRYGGQMPSGWTRKVLEDFEFPGFDAKTVNFVFPPDLDAGNLRAKYDVLIFNGGGFPGGAGGQRGGGDAAPPAGQGGAPQAGQRAGFVPEPIPDEFARRQGQVTAKTIAAVRQFVEDGGTVIAIGTQASAVAEAFGLPVANHLVENGKALPREKFYAPGCVLRVAIDNTQPVAHGLAKTLDVFFQNDPVFALAPEAAAKNTRSIGWFETKPLRSGWAWGENYLERGVQLTASRVGKGRVYLLAPEVLFRAQPHGGFKLFFNGIYLSVTEGLE